MLKGGSNICKGLVGAVEAEPEGMDARQPSSRLMSSQASSYSLFTAVTADGERGQKMIQIVPLKTFHVDFPFVCVCEVLFSLQVWLQRSFCKCINGQNKI